MIQTCCCRQLWQLQTRVKRTALFGEFLWINAAFDWNTARISRVTHHTPSLRPKTHGCPSFHTCSCCKTQWHAGRPSVTIADNGKVRMTNIDGQRRLAMWSIKQGVCPFPLMRRTWSRMTSLLHQYGTRSASLQPIETRLTEQCFSSTGHADTLTASRHKMSTPSLAIVNCDQRKQSLSDLQSTSAV